jgi:antibiotic biosynthesis monooxygenase (ABM) superfamily enzyme
MAVEEGRAVTGDDWKPVARLPKAPKRWKQFCITLAGVYPLTVVIPITLTWLSHCVPPLTVFAIRGMVSATLLVTGGDKGEIRGQYTYCSNSEG